MEGGSFVRKDPYMEANREKANAQAMVRYYMHHEKVLEQKRARGKHQRLARGEELRADARRRYAWDRLMILARKKVARAKLREHIYNVRGF